MDTARIRYLFTQYEEGKATEAERSELFALFEGSDDREAVGEFFIRELEESPPAEPLDRETWLPVVEHILAQKRARVLRLNSFRNSALWKAAAVIILLLGIGSWWLWHRYAVQLPETANTVVHYDVAAPTVTRAVITLAGGRKLYLDSTANGSIATQGNTRIIKQVNGEIAYQVNIKKHSAAIQYNTLDNPRGSRAISIALADGSKVWLNSGSSLTYPVAFAGNERRVEIRGEAYFEIAHNTTMPFIVKKEATEITVLGTHFNVNAYDDEPAMKVTLLEGSVQVVRGDQRGIMTPGQQAILAADKISIVSGADTEEAIAWKNGLFQFSHADVETVMKQVARWYDVEVVYEGQKPSKHFGGKISRNVNASEMLQVIAASGIHFRIEDKRIIVMP